MSTTLHTNRMDISLNTVTVHKKTQSKSTFWDDAENLRFAITPILLIIVACIGGFAAAFGIKESVYQLGLITIPAATVLAMILSLAPMRITVITSIVSVVLSLAVILF